MVLNLGAQKAVIDSRIILAYNGNKGPEYQKEAANLIETIKVGNLEGIIFFNDLAGCLTWLSKEEREQLFELIKELKITVIYHHKQDNKFHEIYNSQVNLLKLNDPRNICLLASFIAFNQTSSKSNKLVTFSPKDYLDQNSNIKSVTSLLDELSNDLSEKREKLNRYLLNQKKALLRPSQINATVRAFENARTDRLFEDRLSFVLAGPEAHHIAEKINQDEQRPYVAVRTRYVDDWLIKSVLPEVKQIIILGAGMDTRAFRLEFPSDTVIFEVDKKEVLDKKNERLNKVKANPNCRRVNVPADLTQSSWKTSLSEKGYDSSKLSAIIMEGVQMYLTEQQLHNLLRDLSNLTADGSFLFMDVINRRAFKNHADVWEWKSGFDVPEHLFNNINWIPTIKQPGDEGASFGRYTSKLPPRNEDHTVERVFLCTAQKAFTYYVPRLRKSDTNLIVEDG